MTTIKEITAHLDETFPSKLRADWDTTDGFLQGNPDKEAKEVIVALELNKELVNKKADLIILHHPPRFGKDKTVSNPFYSYLPTGVPIYVLHSRIDASGFINKNLASFLFGKFNIDAVLDDGTAIISLSEKSPFLDIITSLKKRLRKDMLKVIQKTGFVKKIAIHGGEGFNQHHVEKAAKENVDLYIAGDLNHHQAESAFFYEISLIDIDHTSEQIGFIKLKENLQDKFPDCNFEYVNSEPFWSLR